MYGLRQAMYVAFLLCYVNLRYLLARGNIAELRCCVSIPNDLGSLVKSQKTALVLFHFVLSVTKNALDPSGGSLC